MKFQNCILINFERTDGRSDGRTRDAQTSRKQYALQLFQSWGHNKRADMALGGSHEFNNSKA